MTALPLVAVLLGTDHHPFDRLVRWSTELASVGTCTCFVQHGSTPLPELLCSGVEGAAMLESAGLADLLERADVVVTHGGPGLIMEARQAGHEPVVVPRDPTLGEHVDQHQLRFTEVIARNGMAVRATTQAEFEQAVHQATLGRRQRRPAHDTTEVCDRFGALAESLRLAPRRRMPVR